MDTAQALFDKAQKLLSEGKSEEALPIYNALLNRQFNSPELLYLVADCFIRREWNGAAINLLGIALQQSRIFKRLGTISASRFVTKTFTITRVLLGKRPLRFVLLSKC